MKTKHIHHNVLLAASATAIFTALMNSRTHSKITDSKAPIGTSVGSAFSVWNGGVNGITLFLAPGKKIVQAWRTEEWPDGHYSVATFSFEKAEKETRLTFDQYGVPADDYAAIARNWKECYWNPMKVFFGEKKNVE